MAAGIGSTLGGAVSFASQNPLAAAGIVAGITAAVVGTVLFAPVAIPAIVSAGSTIGTNYLAGQGLSLAMGLARDAGELIHPNLGQAIGYAQTGVQVFNAVTSLADGLGTLASVDPGQLGSIFASTEGLSAVSSVTGNLSTLTRQAGVDVPGLEWASTLISYAALGSQLSGNQTMLARAISPEPINFEATGAQVAGMAPGRSQAEVAALVASARSGNAQAAVALAAQGKGPFEIAMPEEMGPNSEYDPSSLGREALSHPSAIKALNDAADAMDVWSVNAATLGPYGAPEAVGLKGMALAARGVAKVAGNTAKQTVVGMTRNGAFRQAKRDANIPVTQKPIGTRSVPMTVVSRRVV